MDQRTERRDATRLLAGLEEGGMSHAEAVVLGESLDPVSVYLVVSFLRANYPASDPAARSVLERVVRLTSASPDLVRKHGDGERDPVSRWFEAEYSYKDFRGRGADLVDLIVDKLDS